MTSHPHWRAEFERLTRRKHPNQAIAAIARKLLVAVWHVLTERPAARPAQPEMVAFPQRGPAGKLMVWSWKLSDQEHGGLTSRQFTRTCGEAGVRYYLLRLQLSDALTHITNGKSPRRLIAPTEELLVLRPKLCPAD